MNVLETYKVACINALAMVVSFTSIESILKIILLLVSIVYTVYKIIEIKKKHDKGQTTDKEL